MEKLVADMSQGKLYSTKMISGDVIFIAGLTLLNYVNVFHQVSRSHHEEINLCLCDLQPFESFVYVLEIVRVEELQR